MSNSNNKKSAVSRAAVPGIAAILLMALIGSNSDRIGTLFTGGGNETTDTVVEASQDRLGGDVTLRLDQTTVYLNEEALVYEEGNLEDLQDVLKEHLESLMTDGVVLSIDYDDGDYNTYQAVKEALDQMAVEAVEIHHE